MVAVYWHRATPDTHVLAIDCKHRYTSLGETSFGKSFCELFCELFCESSNVKKKQTKINPLIIWLNKDGRIIVLLRGRMLQILLQDI